MDNKLFNKAVDALNEFMASQNARLFDPPTKELSQIDDEYVYLANNAISFGKYKIATAEFIPEGEE